MAEEKTAGAAKAAPAKAAAAASAGDDNLIGALCYVPLVFLSILVPLFILLTEKKQNKALAFHAWQALILTVVVIVVFGALGVVSFILSILNGTLGALLSCPMAIVGFALFVFMCFVAYKTYQGEKYMIPVVGAFAEKQASK